MTAAPTEFQHAMKQSMIGHVAVIALSAIVLVASQWVRPADPIEDIIEVALIAGPAKAGGFGAPPPDAVPDRQPVATPPPEQTKIEEPKIKETEIKEPEIKEPPRVKIEEPKQPDPAPIKETVPEKPVVESKPEPEKTKHQVQVSTKIVKVDTPKNQPQPPPDKKKVTGTPLTADQLAKILNKGVDISRNGGIGLGDPKNTGIQTGRVGSDMEIYKAALKARLYLQWQRPPGIEGLRTVVKLSIARNGSFNSASITRRSGSDAMDESAMQAVRSVPPAPLPSSISAPLAIEVEFDASGVSV